MTFHPADSLSLALFLTSGCVMFGLLLIVFRRTKIGLKYSLGFITLVLLSSILAAAGLMRAHLIPLVPIFMMVVLLMAVFYAWSPLGDAIATKYSLGALVGFQAFRLPLEIILHDWANTGVIPETMTWTGQNWDVVTGVLAIAFYSLVKRFRPLAWIFEVIGSLLLLNVLRVVIFSLPLPFSWSLENPLQLPLEFPYILIVPLFVWPALFGHLVLLKKLLQTKDSTQARS